MRRRAQLASELFAGLDPTQCTRVDPTLQSSVMNKPCISNLSADSGYNEQNRYNPASTLTDTTLKKLSDEIETGKSIYADFKEDNSGRPGFEPAEDMHNISSNLTDQDVPVMPRSALRSLVEDDSSSVYSEDSLSTSPTKKSLSGLHTRAVSKTHQSMSMYTMSDATTEFRSPMSSSMYTIHDSQTNSGHEVCSLKSREGDYTQEWLQAIHPVTTDNKNS